MDKSKKGQYMDIGDIIRFGNYEWKVLDIQGNKALIITKEIIDQMPYHNKHEAVTWETSSLRDYLNNDYVSREYICGIEYSYSIKNVFTRMIPHWYTNRDQLSWVFDSLEEAKEKAVKSLSYINKSFTLNGVKMSYFVLPNERKGTAYHEFQTGNKSNLFWNQTSLLLSEDMMEETKLGEFFAKIIPNYNYYGETIINKELWSKILQEVESETNVVIDIIIEMKSWADNSINLYGCFTIKGI